MGASFRSSPCEQRRSDRLTQHRSVMSARPVRKTAVAAAHSAGIAYRPRARVSRCRRATHRRLFVLTVIADRGLDTSLTSGRCDRNRPDDKESAKTSGQRICDARRNAISGGKGRIRSGAFGAG